MMRTLVIYTSIHHGNTKKIAERIAGVLNAKLLKTDEVSDLKILREYDLIGFGSGIYGFRHHKSLLELVDRLPNQKNKKTFIFSTSGSWAGTKFHKALSKRLLDKGFDIIGEFSCKGYDTFGPLRFIGGMNKGRPNEKDLVDAEEFARGLKET
jgi:flavodoxin